MMASPLSGFNAMYFGRIDYADMGNRRNTKSERRSDYIT